MRFFYIIISLVVANSLFGGSINQLADWKQRLTIERIRMTHRVLITNVEISHKKKKIKVLRNRLLEYEENLKIIKDQEDLIEERALMIAKKQEISAKNVIYSLPEFTGLINSMFHLFI